MHIFVVGAAGLPGLGATVGNQIEALRRTAWDEAVRLIRGESDSLIVRIISGWPRRFSAARAEALGFRAETSFDDFIRPRIGDERENRVPA